LDSYEFPFDSNFFPILYSADVKCFEMFDCILEAHPESSIPFFLTMNKYCSYCVFDLWSPFTAFLTPVTFPFERLKRRSDVKELITKDIFDHYYGKSLAFR